MSPAVNRTAQVAELGGDPIPTREAARMNRAAWRHGHFAAKSAPQHRDFAAGKVEAVY